jgi:hypothetical protein
MIWAPIAAVTILIVGLGLIVLEVARNNRR